MAQLKDPAFLATTWLAPTSATLKDGDNTLPYSSNLHAANATLNMPTNDGTSPNFNTGVINLAPIQQLYVALQHHRLQQSHGYRQPGCLGRHPSHRKNFGTL
jgi:hypothetical protein